MRAFASLFLAGLVLIVLLVLACRYLLLECC